MVKLYKMVDGQIRLVDFGMESCTELYRARGFIVRPAGKSEPVYHKPAPRKIVKPTWKERISNFINSIIPMEVCYA
jgi:hypothetical protein